MQQRLLNTKSFDVGTVARLYASFTDSNCTPIDPTSVEIQIKDPSGAVTQANYPGTIIRSSVGSFYYDFLTTIPGVHYFRYTCAGAAIAASDSAFTVLSSPVLS